METKKTDRGQEQKQRVENGLPETAVRKTHPSELEKEKRDEEIKGLLEDAKPRGSCLTHRISKDADDSINTNDSVDTMDTPETEQPKLKESATPTASKRIGSKQRKESLDEYRETFLSVPKLEDRKPVFVSGEVRDRLDEIVRKLGGRRMSVSGLIENLARHHLNLYEEDIEVWRKL